MGSKILVQPKDEFSSHVSTLRCPSDKSLTHRALIFAGLAKGNSFIENPLLGEDCRSTMAALTQLGCQILESRNLNENQIVEVRSPGFDRWQSPLLPLDFGNSGTTTRLFLGLLSSKEGLFSTIFGDQSLSKRPMLRVVDLLREMGAKIMGRQLGEYLPMALDGTALKPCKLECSKASAQVKSAIMLAGLNVKGRTTITLPRGGRDHTEKLLEKLGCWVERLESEDGLETLSIEGPFRPEPLNVKIPADPSSNAFFAVLPILYPGLCLRLEEVLTNRTRNGYLSALKAMGLSVKTEESHDTKFIEQSSTLVVGCRQRTSGIRISESEVPSMVDEIPILAVASSFLEGESRFSGLGELRVKESDRLELTCSLLQKAGIHSSIERDELIVQGVGSARVEPFSFDPEGDHRLAMSAAVLALRAKGPCEIFEPECVNVSFPGFFECFDRVL